MQDYIPGWTPLQRNERALHEYGGLLWYKLRGAGSRHMRYWSRMLRLLSLAAILLPLGAQPRWSIDSDGGIVWKVERGAVHQDHIEMSGRKVSLIVNYGVDAEGRLTLRPPDRLSAPADDPQ